MQTIVLNLLTFYKISQNEWYTELIKINKMQENKCMYINML